MTEVINDIDIIVATKCSIFRVIFSSTKANSKKNPNQETGAWQSYDKMLVFSSRLPLID